MGNARGLPEPNHENLADSLLQAFEDDIAASLEKEKGSVEVYGRNAFLFHLKDALQSQNIGTLSLIERNKNAVVKNWRFVLGNNAVSCFNGDYHPQKTLVVLFCGFETASDQLISVANSSYALTISRERRSGIPRGSGRTFTNRVQMLGLEGRPSAEIDAELARLDRIYNRMQANRDNRTIRFTVNDQSAQSR